LEPIVTVKTLTDYHLEAFLRCPYKFYYQFILGKRNDERKWRQMVQQSVNKTIQRFYRMPIADRNSVTILKLINHYWANVHIDLFENQAHYYTILAKITNHLLKALLNRDNYQPPLFLYEKLHTSVEEMSTDISITFEVGEWGKDTFSIKKFLVDTDEDMIHLYTYLTILFSHKAFGMLPEKIEILSLLDGKKHEFCPTEKDIPEALEYLNFLKEYIQNPKDYLKIESTKECSQCSLKTHCEFKQGIYEEDQETVIKRMIH
jgi:hypothetical protein